MPEQIEWEWLEYKQRFNALFDKINSALARQAKAQDREAPPHRDVAPSIAQDKAALRHHAAVMRGIPIGSTVAIVPDEEEDP